MNLFSQYWSGSTLNPICRLQQLFSNRFQKQNLDSQNNFSDQHTTREKSILHPFTRSSQAIESEWVLSNGILFFRSTQNCKKVSVGTGILPVVLVIAPRTKRFRNWNFRAETRPNASVLSPARLIKPTCRTPLCGQVLTWLWKTDLRYQLQKH